MHVCVNIVVWCGWLALEYSGELPILMTFHFHGAIMCGKREGSETMSNVMGPGN